MKHLFFVFLAALFMFSSCGAAKSEYKEFTYPEWFSVNEPRVFKDAHCVSFKNEMFIKHYDKDMKITVISDRKHSDKVRFEFGSKVYEYKILEVKENPGRLLSPVKQEYTALKIKGAAFSVFFQRAIDIVDSTRIRPEGFWMSLPKEEFMSSTAMYNQDSRKWGGMLLIK